MDSQTSPLTWHQVSPHRNHSIQGQRSHRFHQQSWPLEGSNTSPSAPCQDRPPHRHPTLAGILCLRVRLCSGNCQWRGGTRAGRDEGHSRSTGLRSLCQGAGTAPRLLSALKSTGAPWVGLLLRQCPRVMTSGRQCAEASVPVLNQGTHSLCILGLLSMSPQGAAKSDVQVPASP